MSKPKRSYVETLGAGTKGEVLVSQLLLKAGISNQKNPETKNKALMIEWDLEAFMGQRRFTLEVKFDQMEQKTGNVAVEYWNVKQCKPSGISATSADIWCFCFSDGTVWMANTSRLRQFIADTKPFREISCGGDQNAAMKLYKREVILPSVFLRIDNIFPAQAIEVLNELLQPIVR